MDEKWENVDDDYFFMSSTELKKLKHAKNRTGEKNIGVGSEKKMAEGFAFYFKK